MADSLRLMCAYMARGLKDSIWGIFRVYHMDRDPEGQEVMSQEPPVETLSTLARRRHDKRRFKQEPKTQQESKVLHRILLCCAWNGGVFWLSILIFNGVLLPSLHLMTHFLLGDSSTHHAVWSWTAAILSWTFSALWILPLFVLSKVVNGLWFQDIADAAYRKSRGRPQPLLRLSQVIADILFSLLLQSLFLIQGMLASLLPISAIGQAVCMLHMCLLYSLYAFEYKWFNMGWVVQKRLSYIENNWPYFVGFGLPLAVLTHLPSSYIVSGCVFSLLFPLFIISANEAQPIQDTFDFPLRLFQYVVATSNVIFRQSVQKTQPQGAPLGTPSKAHRGQAGS